MFNLIRLGFPRTSIIRHYSSTAVNQAKVYSRTYKRAGPVTKSSTSTSRSTSTDASPASSSSPKESVSEIEPSSEVPVKSTTSYILHDAPLEASNKNNGETINWSDSFHGLGAQPFSKEIAEILLAPVAEEDIEIKPDGLLYLPEIKYRRVLNRAFGPGGWGLAPRTESLVTSGQISREYGLICHGRLVSIARGEQDYFGGEEKLTTALEGCKSNALMRCCKDLGIASELWDPSFIRRWKKKYCEEIFVEHVNTKKKKKIWKLKSIKTIDYPYKMT